MILTIDPHPLWGWCSLWPDGTRARPALWAQACMEHDIIHRLLQPHIDGVVAYGSPHVYTWADFGGPMDYLEADEYLREHILAISHSPALSLREKLWVRVNAWLMFLGLCSPFSYLFRRLAPEEW